MYRRVPAAFFFRLASALRSLNLSRAVFAKNEQLNDSPRESVATSRPPGRLQQIDMKDLRFWWLIFNLWHESKKSVRSHQKFPKLGRYLFIVKSVSPAQRLRIVPVFAALLWSARDANRATLEDLSKPQWKTQWGPTFLGLSNEPIVRTHPAYCSEMTSSLRRCPRLVRAEQLLWRVSPYYAGRRSRDMDSRSGWE
jgi:hypothetical protein